MAEGKRGVTLDEWRQMGGNRQRRNNFASRWVSCHYVRAEICDSPDILGPPAHKATLGMDKACFLSNEFNAPVHFAGTMRSGATGN